MFGKYSGRRFGLFAGGGYLNHCIPAVSDLDFTVLTKSLSPKVLEELRKTYRRLKRKYWLPGEVLLCDTATWKKISHAPPPILLLCLKQKQFSGGSWKWQPLDIPSGFRWQSRFSIGIHYYLQALDILRKAFSTGPMDFHLTSFHHSIRKVIDFTTSENTPQVRTEDPASLLARALGSLHNLSTNVRGEHPLSPKIQITPVQEKEKYLLGELWLNSFFTHSQHSLLQSMTPFVQLYSHPPTFSSLEKLFARYIHFLHSGPISATRIPAYVFSPQMEIVFQQGWGGWTRPLFAYCTESLRERLQMRYLTLSGMLLYERKTALCAHLFQCHQEARALYPSSFEPPKKDLSSLATEDLLRLTANMLCRLEKHLWGPTT